MYIFLFYNIVLFVVFPINDYDYAGVIVVPLSIVHYIAVIITFHNWNSMKLFCIQCHLIYE